MELLTNSTVLVKTPESDNQTQPPSKLSNGDFKHHPIVVTYKQCLKNHAAALGAHAVDGCGEFMSSPTSNPDEPTSLKCAACGCHRNFHRRQPEEPLLLLPPPPTLEFRPHHRHHPPPPPGGGNISSSENSPSPPPISSAYYPSSAPHMLMFALNNSPILTAATNAASINLLNSNRKRSRTRFTRDQKVKMLELAERLEWKMQKKDEDLINRFCSEIGVEKGVFRVWMHNNKSISSKKDHNIAMSTPPAVNNHVNGVSYDVNDDRKENVVGNNSPSISR